MKHTMRALALMTVLLLTAALCGCSEQPPAETQAPTYAQVEIPAAEETEAVRETEAEEFPPLLIETPYCTLSYPSEWSETLRTQITGEAFDTAVGFYGTVAGEEYLLFTLYFGGAEGFSVGVLQTEDGVMLDVTAEMEDFPLKNSWTQEETDRICAMQEAMNYVIGKLKDVPGFTPAE